MESVMTEPMPVEAPVTMPDSGPAEAPASPVRWGPDESGDAVRLEQPPTDTAVTSEMLGGVLDENFNVSESYMETLKAKATKPRAKTAKPATVKGLEDFGTFDEIKETLRLAANIYTEPAGIEQALLSIHKQSPETFQKAIATAVAIAPVFAIEQLTQTGYLPLGLFDEPQPRALPADLKAAIPEELREYAGTLPTSILYQWAAASLLAPQLEQHKQIHAMWLEMKARQAQEWQATEANARNEGREQLANLHEKYTAAHYEQLSKWQPFPDNPALNKQFHRMVFASALDELLSDPKWQEIHGQMQICFLDAPLWRIFGEFLQADAYDRAGRELAGRFNVKLGQIMKNIITHPEHGLMTVLKGQKAKAEPTKEAEDEPQELAEDPEDPRPYPFDGMWNLTPEFMSWLDRHRQRKTKGKGA